MALPANIESLSDAEAWLGATMTALEALYKRGSYSIGDRSLTMADAQFLRAEANRYREMVNQFRAVALGASGGGRVSVATWRG